MAALTDLTWQQLASELPVGAIMITPATTTEPAKVMVDVSLAADISADVLATTGVVKFFSMMFTAANKAQATANEPQIDGEKLAAFNPATIGANANGYITLTRPFVCRSELATATNIIGTNA